MRNTLYLAVMTLALLMMAATCEQPPTRQLKPVNVTSLPEGGTLSNEPNTFTVIAQGRVIDKETGELITDATTVVVTVTGSHLFRNTATWEVMFPAMSIADIRAEAPGYKPKIFQLKAHYERNVTIDVKIQLERDRPKLDSGV